MFGTWKKCWLILVVMIGLVACVDDTQMAEGGIGGTGISNGPINGFGSIIVNGVHFDVSQAQIWMDGKQASEQDLQHGMVVTVYGDIDQKTQAGMASEVVFNVSLRGVVESIDVDVDGQWLMASGQRVNFDELTVFNGVALAEFVVGMSVFISGVNDAAGDWLATYIYSDEVALNASSTANVEEDGVLNGGILNDDGQVISEPLERQITPGEWVSLKGLIAEVAGNRFTLQGNRIEINANSRYENGAVADIAVNSHVAVVGVVDGLGVIVANTVRFRPAEVVRIDAQVEFLTESSVTLAGIIAGLSSSTLMLDSSVAAERAFSVQNLAVGDALVVYGFLTTNGVELTRLERFDSVVRQRISGPVEHVGQPVFDLLGVTVDTSTMADSDNLFATMSSGDWVTVAGSLNGAVLVADEVVFVALD